MMLDQWSTLRTSILTYPLGGSGDLYSKHYSDWSSSGSNYLWLSNQQKENTTNKVINLIVNAAQLLFIYIYIFIYNAFFFYNIM